MSVAESLREKIRDFPQTPGVYFMKNDQEKILYVGKAKNLRARVRSYFTESKDLSPKTKLLVRQIAIVDYFLTKTEVEAFLLEASLIKKHRPRYNIRLKDDKAYPYIRVSATDRFPRFYLARRVKKDGSLYFGPYTSGAAVWGTIRFLNRTFLIRDCKDAFMATRRRPCLTHEIGRCSAPCVGLITTEAYGSDIRSAIMFLRGKDQAILRELKKKMKAAASEERFEVAAKLRDSIEAIGKILERQVMVNDTSEVDRDVISYHGGERGTLVEMIHIRTGRVIGHRSHFLAGLDSHSPQENIQEWLVSFINQYYEDNIIPDELLLPVDLGQDLMRLLEDVLKERCGRDIRVRFPTDGAGQDLLEMANKNAISHFAEHVGKDESRQRGLKDIQDKLHLPELPTRIECFDISHFQGAETVASQVVFEEGLPSKEHYRRYKIRSVKGPDDFQSMREVLERRLAHKEMDDPQLIVVDGGKGQLGVAVEALKQIGRADIPVVGLAKARVAGAFSEKDVSSSEERFFLPGRSNPVVFRPASEAFQILAGVRDEAHRFALAYHRRLRQQSSLESELDAIIGLGEKRKRTLLSKFRGLDEVRAASVEQIATLPGFNRVLAERIQLHLADEASFLTEVGDSEHPQKGEGVK